MNTDLFSKAADQARGLAIDAVHASSSGHLGLPLGCAEIGAVLFGHALSYNPAEPRWINRDRLVLSAGHGSMFLYAWLHIAGYDLPMEELRNFRQLHSKTPGHPEFRDTPGVEATTGPLGQGVGNAVGMAVSAKMAAAKYNTANHKIFDHHIVCVAGDGCLQEGVAMEASAFAGHFGLDNLILIYDSNGVTLDAMASATQSEDTAARYAAIGFDVITIDGHDMFKIAEAVAGAKASDDGRPKLIIARTLIGKGIPEVAGTAKAHGESGAKHAVEARRNLGLPDDPWFVSDDVRSHFAARSADLARHHAEWQTLFDQWRTANPGLATELQQATATIPFAELLSAIPPSEPGAKLATRKAGQAVLQPLAAKLPKLMSGSADLHGSTNNYLADGGDFTSQNRAGRNIRFGIREHAMGAILNGIAYDGTFQASGATFLVFSDYMRPAIRLAALSRLPVTYIFTHDSVGVGEDGPTHQPVEMVSALRLIPNLDVIRPADAEETAGAFAAGFSRADGPTALILTRQNLPALDTIPAEERRHGTERGAYIARRESGKLEYILLATGSELQHALAAAEQLGTGTRVISAPCLERFDRQPAAYRDEILPPTCTHRVAIEAGVPHVWHKYTGSSGTVIGIERFGLSAPGAIVMQELGIHTQAVVDAARNLA